MTTRLFARAARSANAHSPAPAIPAAPVPHRINWYVVRYQSPHHVPLAVPMQIQPIAQLVLNRQQFLQFVQRRVASAAAAEDIVQNAYIRAIENVSMLRQQESAAAWFYRVLRNAIVDYYRHRSAEDRAFERLARDSTDMQPPPKSEEIECECIDQVLPVLKPSYSDSWRS
jgi:sigma-70-like protein